MNTFNLFASQDQRTVLSSARTPFHPLVALAGAAMAGVLGLTLTLALTTMVGADWTLRLVMAAHATFSFGILGAWIAASFAMDDRDDIAVILPLPISFSGPTKPGLPPRVAA